MTSAHNDPRYWRGRPCMYFLATPARDIAKIGFTGHLEERLEALRRSSPVPLDFLGAIDASREDELEMHEAHRERRLHGEWFRSDPDFACYLECVAGLWALEQMDSRG